jgi:hypothetical protein
MIAATGASKVHDLAIFDVPTPVLCAYGIFSAVSFAVYHLVADREPSSTLTLSALAQCLGVSLLWIQVRSGKGAWGISARSLFLDALAICLRLCSTLFLDGYLPNSTDGDFVYQFFDVCSVLLILFLLRSVVSTHADTYQATEDTLPVGYMLLGCFVAAAFLHGDMDDNPICDMLWMAGLLTSVVAVLPQFWLITKSGGQAGALTSHYISSMAFSRLLAGCFAFMAWEHLSCEPYIGDFQHARWVIVGAHVVHVLILCDFLFVYLRSMAKNGIYGTMNFGEGLIRQGASYV